MQLSHSQRLAALQRMGAKTKCKNSRAPDPCVPFCPAKHGTKCPAGRGATSRVQGAGSWESELVIGTWSLVIRQTPIAVGAFA